MTTLDDNDTWQRVPETSLLGPENVFKQVTRVIAVGFIIGFGTAYYRGHSIGILGVAIGTIMLLFFEWQVRQWEKEA